MCHWRSAAKCYKHKYENQTVLVNPPPALAWWLQLDLKLWGQTTSSLWLLVLFYITVHTFNYFFYHMTLLNLLNHKWALCISQVTNILQWTWTEMFHLCLFSTFSTSSHMLLWLQHSNCCGINTVQLHHTWTPQMKRVVSKEENYSCTSVIHLYSNHHQFTVICNTPASARTHTHARTHTQPNVPIVTPHRLNWHSK